MPEDYCGGVVRTLEYFKMKSRQSCRSSLTFPSLSFAVGVGLLCVVYIQTSHSASISVSSDGVPPTLEPVVANNSSPASPPPASKSSTKTPTRITTLKSRLGKPFKEKKQRIETPPPRPRPEHQPGRMKASDIKACISKAFCEVNSASKVPNYAVNKEFFDLMNQIHADEDEEADSGSTSVEYDDEDEDEEDDDDASSEESSSERLRGYPPPPGPPPPGYRFGRKLKHGDNSTAVTTTKTKDGKKKTVLIKKSGKKTKVVGKKTLKKYANGTLIAVPKRRRSRLEVQQEKAQQEAYLTRKQREMGQVNDLAALIRISADIGLTLRNPRKCRTLFNKCTMSHEQIVDLFNQTLMAVTTPATSNNAPNLSSSSSTSFTMPTTKKAKVTTYALTVPTMPSKPQSTSVFYSEAPTISTSTSAKTSMSSAAPTVPVTTQTPRTTTAEDRSSKSRHDFSDEDVEYLTDTEIAPVQTYALFVNDAPEEAVRQDKTAEEVTVQETFKKYANAFPAESPLPGDLPSLRERNTKTKNLKVNGSSGRSNKNRLVGKKGKPSSEEEDDDDDDDEDDMGSVSLENRSGYHSSRIDPPYHGYREMNDAESGEPASIAKESNEGILPPLVQKEKPNKGNDDDEEEDEEDSEESVEEDAVEANAARSKSKSKKKGGAKHPVREDESSEEDDIGPVHDDHQAAAAPWTPVYQMHMSEKEKKGHKKKQKGPYKGGEGPYDDIPHPGFPPAPSHSSGGGVISSALNSLKKPWGGSSASQEMGQEPGPHQHHHHPSSHSQEIPYGDAPYHHGGPPPNGLPYGGGPMSSSQENGGGSEQKPGFFQSIMSWFTGNKNNEQGAPHQPDSPYGPPTGPYGGQPPYQGGGSAEHHHQHHRDDHHHDDRESATGAPWPSQPDPANVGHFGQSHAYRYRNPESSEEESIEEVLVEEPIKLKKKKRRFRGRSDSIITSPPKKTSPVAKKGKSGPPPPIVIVPKKDTKSAIGSIGVYEQLIQADGGITSGSNMGKKKTTAASNKEYKRTKKAAIKPKSTQNQTPASTKKKQRKASQKTRRGSRESYEDDDEVYSSEEIYNQQVAKLKTAGSMEIVSLGGGSSSSNGANNGGSSSSSSNKNSNKSKNKQSNTGSFVKNFESMFGTEEKDKHTIKGKDDGGLLYGFDALSTTLNASPLELPAVTTKKKPSTYKVNKNKKKQKKKGNSPPVKFENKEVNESSEEEDKKK